MTVRANAFLTGASCLLILGLVRAQQPRDTPAGPPKGTAFLAGTVVTDDSTHRPVRRATVSVTGTGWPASRQVATDDEGRFLFAALPAGMVAVTATKPGFVMAYYGGKKPGRGPALPIALEEGQRVMDVVVKITHGAAITGAVVDQNGRPQPDVRVTVYEFRNQNGERTLVNAPASNSGGTTDDRGIYRIWGLPPGAFVISAMPQNQSLANGTRLVTADELRWAQQQLQTPASHGQTPTGVPQASPFPTTPASPMPPSSSITQPAPEPGRTIGYAPVYYPGVSDPAQATTITVAPGEERTNVDLTLQLVPTAQVECVVLGLDGQPSSQNMQVTLTRSPTTPSVGGVSNTTRVGADRTGKFTFPAVAPGQYTLTARASSRPPPPPSQAPGSGAPPPPVNMDLWAATDVTIDGQDLPGLILTLRPGMTVSGRLAFDGSTLPVPADLTKVRVGLSQVVQNGVNATVPSAPANADGTFSLVGATPGKFRFNASVPSPPGASGGWTLKSAVLGGRDIADTGFEIRPNENVGGVVLTYIDRQTELAGALLDARGKPTTGYVVLIFTTDRSLWSPGSRRVRQVRPGIDGKFRLTGLPAGEYYVGAIEDLEPPDMGDPVFLEEIAAASLKLQLADGEKKTQNLKLAGGGGAR
jgi:hypothetical protein